MDWKEVLSSVGSGLLGPLGDLLFGGLASLEKAGVAGWVEDNYGGLTKAESQSFDRQLSNSTQLQEQQYNYNSALMDKQYAMQEEFYQKYQSPEAMVNQYRTSGLNPALMYGQGSSAAGGSGTNVSPQGVASPAAGGSASGIVGFMAALGEIKGLFSQAALNSALAKKASAETETIPHQMALTDAQTKYYESLPEKVRASIDNMYAQNGNLAAQAFKAMADANLSQAEVQQVVANTAMALSKFDTEVSLLKSAIQKNEQDINESKAREAKTFQDIKESVSKVILNGEMAQYYKDLSSKTSAEAANQIFVNSTLLPLQEKLLSANVSQAQSEAAIRAVAAEFEEMNQLTGLVDKLNFDNLPAVAKGKVAGSSTAIVNKVSKTINKSLK